MFQVAAEAQLSVHFYMYSFVTCCFTKATFMLVHKSRCTVYSFTMGFDQYQGFTNMQSPDIGIDTESDQCIAIYIGLVNCTS